jgi:hypothetical protein
MQASQLLVANVIKKLKETPAAAGLDIQPLVLNAETG